MTTTQNGQTSFSPEELNLKQDHRAIYQKPKISVIGLHRTQGNGVCYALETESGNGYLGS